MLARMPFDASAAHGRLKNLWELRAEFGMERSATHVFLDEIVSDRMQLLSGLQVLRDELQFARRPCRSDRDAGAADFSQPSVVTTQAFTNCGDRIHHGEIENYQRVVAARFATISEIGTLKPEAFHPMGGGTDDGATLAHVTWAHVLDEPLRKRLYDGNRQSFVLCAFDLKTHVGRLESNDDLEWGKTAESPFREPRAACGAVVGTLSHFNERSDVHRRIRSDLGEENFELLSKDVIRSKHGRDITPVVAASIIAVRGMLDTAHALTREMDLRGVAHLTASVTVNRPSVNDTIIYLARATVFDGKITTQGFGTDARKYAGEIVNHKADKRLRLTYDGIETTSYPINVEEYAVRQSVLPGDIFV